MTAHFKLWHWNDYALKYAHNLLHFTHNGNQPKVEQRKLRREVDSFFIFLFLTYYNLIT